MLKIATRLNRLPWWLWIAAINLVLVVATAMHHKLVLTDRIHFYLRQIDLAIEMNFAAWWSGVLLLILALLAYEIYGTPKEPAKSAWLFLAIAWALLSLDEIGSLHERIEDWMPESWLPWVDPYIPIAVVGLLLVPYPLIRLFSQKATRKTATLLLLGFGCLASIAVQERLEGRIDWGDWWSIRIAIEEGTELLGMSLCYVGLVNHTWKGRKAGGLSGVLPNPLNMSYVPKIVFGGLLIQLAVVVGRALSEGEPFSEHTLVWYPLALSMMLGLSAFWQYRRSPGRLSDRRLHRINSAGWLVLTAYGLMYSAIIPYVIPLTTDKADAFFSAYLYLFYLLQTAVVSVLFVVFRSDFPKQYAFLWAIALITIVSSGYANTMVVRYALPSVFTFLWFQLFFLSAFQQQQQRRMAIREREAAEALRADSGYR